MKAQIEGRNDPVLEELRTISRLLALLLMKGGASQRELAEALGVGQATISRKFGAGDVDALEVKVVREEQE